MFNDSHSNSSLPPIQDDDFLPPIGHWMKFGGVFVVAIVGILFPLAALLQYKVTVKSNAIVRPAGELRLVQAATEGQIQKIFVKEGQSVKAGEAIAAIDNSRLQTKKSQLQNNLQQGQLQLAQIEAQIRALKAQITAETHRTQGAVKASVAEFDRNHRNYQDRKITTVAEVEEAMANLKAAEAALNASRAKLQRYQPIATEGAIAKEQFEEAKLAVEQHQQEVTAAKARLQSAKAALNPSSAEVAIAHSRIAQDRNASQASISALNKEKESLIREKLENRKQLEQERRELQQVEIDLDKAIITATSEGIISQLRLRNSGQTVAIGDEIAQIIPRNTSLEIKATVSPQDISNVEIGQKVQIQISACPHPDYGTLTGKVAQVSQDTIKANGTDRASPAFYEATITPDRFVFGEGKRQCSLQLGMEGRADIITKEETVLQFLLRKTRLIADV